jgi:hypothetical protein
VIGLDDVGARPHPVLVIGAGELVDVKDDVPIRRLGAIALERGPSP